MKKLCILGAVLMVLSACSTTDESKNMTTTDESTTTTSTTPTSTTVTEPAKTATSTVMQGMAANCKLDKDSRVIEVRKTQSGGCELFYTKFGEEKSVASSGFGTQYCEEVKERIESNLNKAGFTCQ